MVFVHLKGNTIFKMAYGIFKKAGVQLQAQLMEKLGDIKGLAYRRVLIEYFVKKNSLAFSGIGEAGFL